MIAMECPACGEISLELTATTNGLEEWECPCGYYCTLPERKMERPKHPGFDEFIKRTGYDALDDMSFMDALRLAFMAGQTYEAVDTINKLKEINTPMFKTQAE